MKEIFEYIEQHHDAYLEELFTFLRCKSISTRDEGVKECAELLAGIMEKSKIKASIYPTDRHPIVYGERIEDETLPCNPSYLLDVDDSFWRRTFLCRPP